LGVETVLEAKMNVAAGMNTHTHTEC